MPLVFVAGGKLFVRYRRSTGSERQQFRWVIRSIVVVPLAFLGASLAVSVLKYHLWVSTDSSVVR